MITEIETLAFRLILLMAFGVAKLLLLKDPNESTGRKILATVARAKVLTQDEVTGKDYKEYFEDIDEE
jgi:hypothetical protein